MEVEAKFTIPDRNTVDRLNRAVRLGTFELGPSLTRQVRDEYYDTAARDLFEKGYACRVRGQGQRRVLTIKGLGQSESGIHERIEHEIAIPEGVGNIAAEAMPDEGIWAEVRAIVGSQSLTLLFTVDQVRYVRDLSQDGRLVAEMSIDEAHIRAGKRSQSLWLLEAELCADGTRGDLEKLSEHLGETWGLQVDPYSKHHRGLSLLDRSDTEAEPQAGRLSTDERAQLEQIVEQTESGRVRKRAQLILGWDESIPVHRLASDIGGSRSWAYGWLARFRAERMAIFPQMPRVAQATKPALSAVSAPAELHSEPVARRSADMSIEDMVERFQVDAAHARRVADYALVLFDKTAEIHGLKAERRRVLEAMGLLHGVGLETDPGRPHVVGRDIILDHPLAELSEIEQRMLAAAVYLHRKRIRRKRLEAKVVTSLPQSIREDTLTCAALLRIADGLDSTKTAESELQDISVTPVAVYVSLSGPAAETNAMAAQSRADLWERLFGVPLIVSTPDTVSQSIQTVEGPLLAEGLPDIESLESPGLLADDPMGEAGRKALRFHFWRMVAHEPGTRMGQDIEELHDMRVATRRMRSALRIFGPYFKASAIRPHAVGLKRTARTLGAVRDLDVLVSKARAYLTDLSPQRVHDLDPLLALWQEQREDARREMLAYLDSAKYRDFCEGFRLFLETPGVGVRRQKSYPPEPTRVRHVVPTLIYTRWARVQAFGAILDGAPISTLHALRIECKRLRYALEFFREVLGPEARQAIAEVVQLQDHLGALNDADVANTVLSDFLFPVSRRDAKDAPGPVIAPGVVAYLATKQQELQALLESFPDVWGQFNRHQVRRWLADAIAVL